MFDFAEAYAAQRAAVYVANTGFGYGDTVANAFPERLMSIFGAQIGRNGTLGADWLRAMHKYYNTMGFYGVYDEKALSEATMYGLPFWSVGAAARPAPDIVPPSGNIATVAVSVNPSTERVSVLKRATSGGRPSTTSCSTRTTARCSPRSRSTARCPRPTRAGSTGRSSPRSTRTT